MRIELERSFDPAEHDHFLRRAEGATFYHGSTWLAGLEAHYGYHCGRLTLREGGELQAVLPFIDSGRMGLVHRVSLPFGTYGGAATAPESDPTAAEQLNTALLDSIGGRVQRVSLFGVPDPEAPEVPREAEVSTERYVLRTQILDLRAGWDDVLGNRIRKEKRRQIRKAERAGVKVARSDDPADVAAYYDIYLEHVRDWKLADPTPLAHLQQLVADTEGVRFWTARIDGEIVGGHFNLHRGDTVIAWNGTARKSARRHAPSVALYAANLEQACREGLAYFNFGGSGANDPLFDFKASFGARPVEYVARRRQTALMEAAGRLKTLRSGD